MASTGNRIEARREALRLTRSQLAKLLKTTYLQVYRIETGKVRLQIKEVPVWAKALKLSPAELVA